jgi:phosphate transport system substrate-binding protein
VTARRIAWGVLFLAGLSIGTGPAFAREAEALVEDALAGLAPPPVADLIWTLRGRDALLGELCAPRAGALLRVALTTRPPSLWQRETCVGTAGAALSDRVIGRRVLVAFGDPSLAPLTAALVYRALAAVVPAASGELVVNPAGRWRALDPALPDAPIRVLVPPDGTVAARILTEVVLAEGCAAAGGVGLSGPAAARRPACTGLRGDPAVVRAEPNSLVSTWLQRAGPGAVALVGLETVVADPGLQTPLPLDGVVPGLASIADGTYRAALPVHLLLLQAGEADEAAAALAGLTAESVIGPGGTLARRGLAALPAAERVRLRAE